MCERQSGCGNVCVISMQFACLTLALRTEGEPQPLHTLLRQQLNNVSRGSLASSTADTETDSVGSDGSGGGGGDVRTPMRRPRVAWILTVDDSTQRRVRAEQTCVHEYVVSKFQSCVKDCERRVSELVTSQEEDLTKVRSEFQQRGQSWCEGVAEVKNTYSVT